MHIVIALLAVAAIAFIFFRAYKRARRTERVKVTPAMMDQEDQQAKTKSFKESMQWKRPNVDYKELHAAFNQADYDLSKGNLKAAEQGFIKVISIRSDHAEANNKLALLYIKQGQHKKAEVIFRFLTEQYPDKPRFFSNLGRALYNQKKLADAAYAYEQAIRLDSKRPERYLSLGQVYREMEQFKLAISNFSKALDLNPRQEDLYFLITDLLDEIKAYSEAVAYLKAMLEIFPYNERAKRLITEFQRKMKLSPLSTEQKSQMREARIRQNTLFNEIPPGETVPQNNREHQSLDPNEESTKNAEPAANQMPLPTSNDTPPQS